VRPKPELLRIAAVRRPAGTWAVADPGARLPGRGAYLCLGTAPTVPEARCVEQALRTRAIPRALRTAADIDPQLVESKGS